MKKILIAVGVVVIVFIIALFYFSSQPDKLRVCPDVWIDNQMPGGGSQYFILDKQRRERSEFDLRWVEENCKDLEPYVVV